MLTTPSVKFLILNLKLSRMDQTSPLGCSLRISLVHSLESQVQTSELYHGVVSQDTALFCRAVYPRLSQSVLALSSVSPMLLEGFDYCISPTPSDSCSFFLAALLGSGSSVVILSQ